MSKNVLSKLLLTIFMMSGAFQAHAACENSECWMVQVAAFNHLAPAKRAQRIFQQQFLKPVQILNLRGKRINNYLLQFQQLSFAEAELIARTVAANPRQRYPVQVKKHYLDLDYMHNTLNTNFPGVKNFLTLMSVPRVKPLAADVSMRHAGPGRDIKKLTIINLTLEEAVLLALRYNPQVTNAQIDRIVQKYQLQQAARSFQFQYSLTGRASYTSGRVNGVQLNDSESYNLTPTVRRRTLIGTNVELSVPNEWTANGLQPTATLNVNQPLLRGAMREVVQKGVNDALDDERINQMRLKGTVISTVATVVKSYRNLILANNNVKIAQNSLNEAVKTFKNNAARIRLGKLPKTVNITQEAQVESIRLQLTQTINARDQARQSLLSTLGLDPDLKIRVPDDIMVPDLSIPDVEKTIEYGIANNLDYQERLINFKKVKRNVIKAKDDTRWRLDLDASIRFGNGAAPGRGYAKIFNGKNVSQTVGLSLDIPIDDLGLKAALVSANINVKQSAANLYQAHRELITNLKNALTDLRSKVVQLQIARRTVMLRERDFTLQRVKLRLGKGTALDISQSQNSLISAQVSLISTKVSYLNALTDLHVLLGDLLDEWKIDIRY